MTPTPSSSKISVRHLTMSVFGRFGDGSSVVVFASFRCASATSSNLLINKALALIRLVNPVKNLSLKQELLLRQVIHWPPHLGIVYSMSLTDISFFMAHTPRSLSSLLSSYFRRALIKGITTDIVDVSDDMDCVMSSIGVRTVTTLLIK